MTGKEYRNIQEWAWYVLIETNATKLPIDIIDICEQLNISIRCYNENHKFAKKFKNGFSVINNGKKTIYINKEMHNKHRVRFTIAHELGHILLNHHQNKNNLSYNDLEIEANMFAIRVLAPLCVLHELKVQTESELRELCRISKKAGEIRFQRFQEKESLNKYYINPMESILIKQFKEFIIKNKKR